MGNMYTTKTINDKDWQHVHHQNNEHQIWATCTPPKQLTTKMGNMHTTKNCFGGVRVAHLCS
jgi:sortase (surface protein transpeptidase)